MISRSVFRKRALASGLVSAEQLEQAARAVAGDSSAAENAEEVSDEVLAAKLIEQGLLTSYQVVQLRDGRTKLNLGPYVVTDYIDKGGMGQVYKAVHPVMGRVCAVKVLPLNKATPDSIATFMREIRTQAQLDHPNLVRAFDAGQDKRVHYLVTEYVPGTDLRRLVRSQGRLTMRQAASVVMQAAIGLDYAHSQKLIHRDIKPGNILVTPQGIAKLSDLGLAGFIHEAEADPLAGKTVGTPDYVAPELIDNPGSVSPASDIYALGCTLYYAITGKVPFPGGNTSDKLRRHRQAIPWHPRRFNPDVSEEFVEIIEEMMAKDPAARIQTAAEVVARLEPWASDVSSFPSAQLAMSPWMPPPLPTGSDEELQDTDVVPFDDDLDSSRMDSGSKLSQGTDLSAGETRPLRRRGRSAPAPPPAEPPRPRPLMSRGVCVAIALAISVPVSMLIGAALTFLLLTSQR